MTYPQPERVVWNEGMLLCPQHLQQQDRFLEASLAARIAAITPHAWGILTATLDEAGLTRGVLRVSQFAAILPDGLPVCVRSDDANAPSSRPLAEHFPATAPMLEVFLAVPIARDGVPAYSDSQASIARFRSRSRPVANLADAQTEHPITLALPNVVVRFGDESREDYEALKVAEIVRDETGQYRQSNDYIPPLLRIDGSSVLSTHLEELLTTVLSKHRALAMERRQVEAATVEFAAQDVARYLLLHALSTAIPMLRHLVEARNDTPLVAYQALSQLAGSLSMFTGDVDPATLPAYRHTDLRSTFTGLKTILGRLLGASVKERCLDVPLQARPDGMWVGQLKDSRLPTSPQFVLAIETPNAPQDTAHRLPKLSKIASWKQIGEIVRSATPGVPLAVTHRPPAEVPVRPGRVYFMLKTDDVHWQRVVSERTVAIYLPPPFHPANARVTLVGIPDQATRG